MEIPQQVQDKLKCSECDEVLSCGPVFLLHKTGGAICGRCSQQPEQTDTNENNDRTRIVPYEAVASLLSFPCVFATRGCPEKVSFTLGQPPHEQICEFRPFICPIAPRGSCDWIGSWPQLKEHCQEKHESNVFENPCNPPRPDLTTSNLQNYLISAFHFLFLLHVKVCVTSGKLFHCVRMFGDPKFLDKFSFSLKVEGNNIKVKKTGSVLRADILTIQEPTAICTIINNLLGIHDGKYNETKFIIKIQTTIILNCLNCSKSIAHVSDSKFCVDCLKKLIKCEFSGKSCSFGDFNDEKYMKHVQLYCKYQTKCHLCKVNYICGSFIEHLDSSSYCRQKIKANIDSVVRLTPNTNTNFTDILFSSNNIGDIICSYVLSNSNFEFLLCTSLPSYELKNYKCSLEITDPQTKHSIILTPQIQYNNWPDWYINKKMDNFPSWKDIGIDLKINLFSKINY